MRASARIALSLLLTAPLFAQVRETVNVTVVEVPVTVVDRDGNPIRGLTAANFELTDDGKKRAVTAFDAIDFASTARRNFMLLFDLSFSNPSSLVRAQQAYPFQVNGLAFIPSAAVRMTRGVPRKFALFVYNAGPEERKNGDERRITVPLLVQ